MKHLEKMAQAICQHAPSPIRALVVKTGGYILKRKRFGGKFQKYYEWLLETPYLSRGKIEAFQMERLRIVLAEAAEHVPYYRKMFREHGFSLRNFQDLRDLKKLPILTKEVIRQQGTSLLNERLPSTHAEERFSSGTTGQKLRFFLSKELAWSIDSALLWRHYAWAGLPLLAKRATLGGRVFGGRASFWTHSPAENQLLLSTHHLSNSTASDYISQLRSFSPVFVQGHPSALGFLSQHILEGGAAIAVKAVFTTGETLEESQRTCIEAAFSCRVFESYGLGESVLAAQECDSHCGFHEASEIGVFEFEEDASTGLRWVIGTSLWNTAMPFIRYRIDDLVDSCADSSCSCGRNLPLVFRKVIGRVDDVVRATSGSIVLPVTVRKSLGALMRPFEMFQLQQTTANQFRLLTSEKISIRRRARIEVVLRSILGRDIQLDFCHDELLVTEGGKQRTVVNLCRS